MNTRPIALATAISLSIAACPVFAQGILAGPGYIDVRPPTAAYTLPQNVAGPRLVWSPTANSFWFGTSSVEWNNLPWNSFSGGVGAFAGEYSFSWLGRTGAYGGGYINPYKDTVAIGRHSEANGKAALAMGYGAQVDADYGIAIGADGWGYHEGTLSDYPTRASGEFGVAIGGLSSAGYWSTSIGIGSLAENQSVAIGPATATDGSVAAGYGATADEGSVALGGGVASIGSFAALTGIARNKGVAIGDRVNASNGGAAFGRMNRGIRRTGEATTSTETVLDPIFEIGNPSWETFTEWDDGQPVEYQDWARNNAFAIYRDNVARFEGPVQIKSGASYVTLAPAGATQNLANSVVLTLPTESGAILSDGSPLSAAKLTGTVAAEQLAQVVKVDAEGYAVADGSNGGVLRVRQAGDIPMFGEN